VYHASIEGSADDRVHEIRDAKYEQLQRIGGTREV
jgi:hypothetical protein